MSDPLTLLAHTGFALLFLIGLIYMGWLVIKGFEIAAGKAGPDYPPVMMKFHVWQSNS